VVAFFALTRTLPTGSLFHSALDQVFHAIIVTQNAAVMQNGAIDEDARKALMHTIEQYGKWLKVKPVTSRA
jgi:hypothetical protein